MLDYSNIKRLAARIGFDLCGMAPRRHPAEGEARFREWIARGYQSSLEYLERNTEKLFPIPASWSTEPARPWSVPWGTRTR